MKGFLFFPSRGLANVSFNKIEVAPFLQETFGNAFSPVSAGCFCKIGWAKGECAKWMGFISPKILFTFLSYININISNYIEHVEVFNLFKLSETNVEGRINDFGSQQHGKLVQG